MICMSKDDTPKEFLKILHDLIDQINKAFDTNGVYMAKRFDDIDKRLLKLESKLDRVESQVSNIAKTEDKIFGMTKMHAHEIPKIEVRLNRLEGRDDEESEQE